ncbi:MAG: hypothetical protein V1908_03260 [Candidatus Peregrinibacteria bacterium]
MIDAVKELFDICPPDEASRMDCQEFFSAVNSGHEPLAYPARPGIMNKCLIVNRNQTIINKPVNHTVADRSHRNDPLFIIAHGECSIGAMIVTIPIQIFVEFQQIPLQIILKIIQFPTGFFAFTESKPTLPDIF